MIALPADAPLPKPARASDAEKENQGKRIKGSATA